VETSQCGLQREEIPTRRFTFSLLADVRAFWSALHSESLNTSAGLLSLLSMLAAVLACSNMSLSKSTSLVTFTACPASGLTHNQLLNPGMWLCVVENFSVSKKWCDEDCLRAKSVNEVVDDGDIPGDGLGICGFDSSLFL